jgi:hypothetical protein
VREPGRIGTRLTKSALVVKLAISVPAGGLAVVGLFLDWNSAPLAQRALGVIAACLAAFQLNNSLRTRRRLQHWKIEGLKRLLGGELLFGAFVPGVIAVIGLRLPVSWESLVAIFLLYGIAYHYYELIEEEIRTRIATTDKIQGTEDFGYRRPVKPWLDVTVDEIAKKKSAPGVWRALSWVRKPSWQETLSRTRTLIVYVMMVCCIFAAGASAKLGFHLPRLSQKSPGGAQGGGKEGGGTEGDDDENAAGGESEANSDDSDACRRDPGAGAPSWAREELRALYFGGVHLNATKPPGTDAGGCPGSVKVLGTGREELVYTVARNPLGEIRSVACVSRPFKGAIFLAPSAQIVLGLINEGVTPIGGYPKVDVAGGDMVAVLTRTGTMVLVRSEKHLPDEPLQAAPYVELPVPVAAAWSPQCGKWKRGSGLRSSKRSTERSSSVSPCIRARGRCSRSPTNRPRAKPGWTAMAIRPRSSS